MQDKVRLTVFLINNVLLLDMSLAQAKEIVQSFREFRTPNKNISPEMMVYGDNFVIVFKYVTAMLYGKIKRDASEAWKPDDEDED